MDNIAKYPPEICTLRVVFAVSSSPFLLNATIKYHLEQCLDSYPDLVPNMIESTYVDDIVTGASSEDEVFRLYSEAKDLHASTQELLTENLSVDHVWSTGGGCRGLIIDCIKLYIIIAAVCIT